MGESFDLPSLDAVTVGTIGVPGRRVFYLQGRAGATHVTLKVEKQQVAGLAAAFQELMEDLPPPPFAETAPELQEPVEPLWTVGGIGLSSYDETTQRVTLLLQELVAEGEEAAEGRLGLSLGQMAALIARGEELVAGGRPPCPLCGNPMDPDGHSCPKTNGHLKH
jgi:uncharacterized repeat protein (TIGR03847 family)